MKIKQKNFLRNLKEAVIGNTYVKKRKSWNINIFYFRSMYDETEPMFMFMQWLLRAFNNHYDCLIYSHNGIFQKIKTF